MYHACARLANGTVQCWGDNNTANWAMARDHSTLPVTVSGISTATSVAVGGYDSFVSCAVLAGGEVQCWGANVSGQLGNGTQVQSSTPVTVSGIDSAKAVGVGDYYGCALLASGAVRCWGANNLGQLGNGTTTNSSTPVAVTGIGTAIGLAVGPEHACALLGSGQVRCWGLNNQGQLGNGTTTGASTPVAVTGINTAIAVATPTITYAQHTCALLSGGTIKCWGRNRNGELGDGTTTNSSTPVSVTGIDTATAVSAGSLSYASYTCALLTGGAMECWGGNSGSTAPPVAVRGIGAGSALATGGQCVVLTSGQVQCLGDFTTFSTPETVIGTSDLVTWDSSDPSVATIDEAGLATSHSAGGTRITATSGAVSGSTQLTVNAPSETADLSVALSDSPDPVDKHATLTYTLQITNNGPSTARHVRLNDTPPASVMVESIEPERGTCGFWGGRAKCWLGRLRSGESTRVVVRVQTTAGGWIVDYATVWSDASDPQASNNKAKTGTWVRSN